MALKPLLPYPQPRRALEKCSDPSPPWMARVLLPYPSRDPSPPWMAKCDPSPPWMAPKTLLPYPLHLLTTE
eukprot:9835668-Karenia_brevis.AAC.1